LLSTCKVVLKTSTRGFSWSNGTQFWTLPPSAKGNRRASLLAVDSKRKKTTTIKRQKMGPTKTVFAHSITVRKSLPTAK